MKSCASLTVCTFQKARARDEKKTPRRASTLRSFDAEEDPPTYVVTFEIELS